MHILTYKYRLKGRRSVRQLRRSAYLANQVWNYCVQIQKLIQRRYREGLNPKWLSNFDFNYLTAGTSKDLGISAKTIQAISKQFTQSRDQHKKCPKFRQSSGPKKSLGWIPFPAQGRQLDGNTITYNGNTYSWFGSKSRPLPKIVKGGAFVEDSRGRWYVILHVEVEDLQIAPDISVGIDLGLHTLATLSDGIKIENPRITAKYAEKLATAQRAGNRDRTKAIHAKIQNSRKDLLHKVSNTLASSYRQFFVGDVSSSKLARTKMAKSVSDASWFTFKNFLRYKASRHGGKFLEVPELFTTQTCSSCGLRPPERPKGIAGLGIRYWCCSLCGVSHDRDVNSALNILSIGLGTQPRFDESRAPFQGVDRIGTHQLSPPSPSDRLATQRQNNKRAALKRSKSVSKPFATDSSKTERASLAAAIAKIAGSEPKPGDTAEQRAFEARLAQITGVQAPKGRHHRSTVGVVGPQAPAPLMPGGASKFIRRTQYIRDLRDPNEE